MPRRLEVEIIGDASRLHRTTRDAEGSLAKLGRAAKYGAAAGVAILGVALEKSVKAAIEAQASEVRLTQAFKNARVAIGPYRKQIEGLESAGRKLGFTDEQTTNSLGSLITATHNMKLATKDLAVAQDLSRFKHVDLADATKMLTMAMTGSQRAAKQLGITVSPVTKSYDQMKATMGKTIDAHEKLILAQQKLYDKQLTGIAVVDAVRDHVKGQAKAYSDTAAGAMEEFHAQLQHIEVAIGNQLLPAMMKAVDWIRANWPQISAVIKKAWEQQIRPALKALIDLVIAVVQTIRQHWGTIGPIVNNVVNIIRVAVAQITAILRLVTALLRGDWSEAWKQIKAIVSNAFDLLKGYLKLQVSVLRAIGTEIIRGLAAGITAGFGLVKKAVTDLFGSVIGWAKHALGIASPSSIFHDIGVNAIKGFVRGVGSMAGALKSAVLNIVKSAPVAALSAAKGIGSAIGGAIHGGAATGSQANRNIGQRVAAAYGWGSGAEWAALDALAMGESGWNNKARNKSSGAYGIAQALPESKYPAAGRASGGSDPAAQVGWMLSYIKSRYGDPINAYQTWQSRAPHWYDSGGVVPGTGPQLAVVHGGETILPTHKRSQTIQLVLPDGRMVAEWLIDPLRSAAQIRAQRTGRAVFG